MTSALVSRIKLETTRAPEFIDITRQVLEHVHASGVRDGLVCVYSKHTTAAVKINENEPLLLTDMEAFLKKIAPVDQYYAHNDFSIRTVNMHEDECPNGHAHCGHLTLGTSETIPIIDGEVQLGTYQSIFVIELDRPREREILVSVFGA
jgi:secondary thiamine-phosphate synthase enzyme